EDQRKPIWWYHTDHLGSSTYLTDNFGRPSHYYETLPFGEMIVEHNQSSYYKSWNPVIKGKYDNKYKFNGKEFDDATGMYYYGARYYDPRISIFVNVDPLAEQFVGWTPYHYVHNNPINLIDPTGMSAEGPHDPPGGEDEGTVLPELVIDKRKDLHQKMEDASGSNLSYGGKYYEHRRQLQILRDRVEIYQRIQEFRDMGIWDDNKEYDNWAHAVGSQLSLAMPSARFAGFFNAFTKTPKGSLSIQSGGSFPASEVAAAEYMQSLGHNVILRSPTGTRAAGATSDLLVSGINFDVYTPTTNNASRIISAIAKKNSQTTGVVLDLSQTSVTAKQLGNVLGRVQGTGASNIKSVVIMPK